MRQQRGNACLVGVVALLSLGAASLAHAQSGTLVGSVRSGGQVLPHARVDAIVANAVRANTSADETGKYRVALAPGEYTILIRLPGYAQRRFDGIRIVASNVTRSTPNSCRSRWS